MVMVAQEGDTGLGQDLRCHEIIIRDHPGLGILQDTEHLQWNIGLGSIHQDGGHGHPLPIVILALASLEIICSLQVLALSQQREIWRKNFQDLDV